jgi:hypothetical protein
MLKYACYDILRIIRMLSIPIPLVNLGRMCQNPLIRNIFECNKTKQKQPELRL